LFTTKDYFSKLSIRQRCRENKKEIKMSNYENKMFGTSVESVESSFATAYNINMRLAGMLSDAQELISMGKTEQANQIINQVKHYFFEYTDTRNAVYAQKQTENV
jgi:hypothetical protein